MSMTLDNFPNQYMIMYTHVRDLPKTSKCRFSLNYAKQIIDITEFISNDKTAVYLQNIYDVNDKPVLFSLTFAP